jgi:glutamate racemase
MKIGFFDSGMGGLFMMQSCIEEYRNHEYVYVGDTKNLPYGPRDSVEIFELMSPYILWLFNEQKCDYVVLACNTASAQSLDMLIQKYPEYKKRLINIVTLTQSYINSEIKDCLFLLPKEPSRARYIKQAIHSSLLCLVW